MNVGDVDGGRGDRLRVHLCVGPNCSVRGSERLLPILEAAVRRAGLSHLVDLLPTSCRSRCEQGPSMNVYPGPVFYNRLTEVAVGEIVTEHLLHARVVDRWLFDEPSEVRRTATPASIASALDRYFSTSGFETPAIAAGEVEPDPTSETRR